MNPRFYFLVTAVSMLASCAIAPSPVSTLDAVGMRAKAGVKHNADWTPYIETIHGVPMALVPAGCFRMGSSDEQITADYSGKKPQQFADEQPVHEVCFEEPFWIDVTEVTYCQYVTHSGLTVYAQNWADAEQPRGNITWTEADAYCRKRGARLPTEAEWEFAARGPDGLLFPWGDAFLQANVVWGESVSAVGSKPDGVSWVGAFDLSGSLEEWVNDWYGRYSSLKQVNPSGPGSGSTRVLRGGSSGKADSASLRAASRHSLIPSQALNSTGFRCALSFDAASFVSSPTPDPGATATLAAMYTGDKLTYQDIHAVYIAPFQSSDWTTAHAVFIEETARQLGIYLTVFRPCCDKDQERGFDQFLTNEEVRVIILDANDPSDWEDKEALQAAIKAGKVFILDDRRLDVKEDLYAAYIGPDYKEQGRKAAEAMCTLLEGVSVKNIWELSGSERDPFLVAEERGVGFHEAMNECGIRITKTASGNWTEEEGFIVTKAWLAESRDVQGIFAQNDEMAFGASEAVRQAGLRPGVDVKIVSIDAVRRAFNAMLAGELNASVEYNPLTAPLMFEAALRALNGEKPQKWIRPEVRVFFADMPDLPAISMNRRY